jgi:anaerobic magnesium-protoporphyrin IX monomethyl ester cyclase
LKPSPAHCIFGAEKERILKLAFVSVENSLSAIGFRKMAALARTIEPELKVFHVVPFKAASPLNRIRTKTYQHRDDPEIDLIASNLAKSEVVCFSSMSTHAEYTKNLIRAIRVKNPRAFIVWGGIHCIVDPEDAIRYADAVCIGEGEKAFPEFLSLFSAGRDYTHVGNFYFNESGRVIRNPLLPLLTSEELGSFPYPLLGDGESIYRPGRGFSRLEPIDYVRLEGLAYNIIWSIGCPNRCVYCGNSKFLNNHKNYGRLRFPSVDYIVDQIVHARERYPHISSVTFQDDMFMAIPLPVLREFAMKWRDRVNLPFAVHGLMSRYVDSQKMKTLISAGMFRVRMGIQSGSQRTLGFYKRPDSRKSIESAIGVIHRFSKYLMPPSYDLIVDNPLETSEDIIKTLDLLHSLPRPFILNVFPLMIIPGTELALIAKEKNLELPYIKQSYLSSTEANALILSSCLWKLPRGIYAFFLRRLANPGLGPRFRPLSVWLLKTFLVLKRALAHFRIGHFSVLPGKTAWILWKLGLVDIANRRIIRKCLSIQDGFPPDPLLELEDITSGP